MMGQRVQYILMIYRVALTISPLLKCVTEFSMLTLITIIMIKRSAHLRIPVIFLCFTQINNCFQCNDDDGDGDDDGDNDGDEDEDDDDD